MVFKKSKTSKKGNSKCCAVADLQAAGYGEGKSSS
jgi:hypothetical protein